VVQQDHGGGAPCNGGLEHLARMDERCGQGAQAYQVDTCRPILPVEKDNEERFTVETGDDIRHEVPGISALTQLAVPACRNAAVLHEQQAVTRDWIRLARFDWFLLVVVVRR